MLSGLDGSAEIKAGAALSPLASRGQTCGESRSLIVPGEGAPRPGCRSHAPPCPGCSSHAPPRPGCRPHVPTTSLGADHMYSLSHPGMQITAPTTSPGVQITCSEELHLTPISHTHLDYVKASC